MQRKIFGIGAIALTLSLAACSSSRMVQGPPRLDLRQYGRVGMLDVTTQPGNTLGTEANRAFVAAIQTAQPGVPVLELGNESQVLRDVGAFLLTPETLRAIGKKHGVETLLVGVLDTKEVRPKVAVGSGLSTLKAKAELEGSLVMKMYDTQSGATIWSSSATDRQTLAAVSVSKTGGVRGGGSSDVGGAKSALVRNLVDRTTTDFRPTWIRVQE